MLFNSYVFIFYFLLPVFTLFWMLRRSGVSSNILVWVLVFASFVFYGEWSIWQLGLLVGSVVFNYGFAYSMRLFERHKRAILIVAIGMDIALLGYFKYSFFLHLSLKQAVLPLAISFFTFQQIGFLVDVYRGKIKLDGFREYLFFVTFFPQLIAGPIVHYSELVPQIKSARWLSFDKIYFTKGVLFFSIGLFKKVVLADSFATLANSAFSGLPLGSYGAWMGVFGYSFQIYFDFSGYADMAIGLGLLFGLRLPVNFDSPYKSRNIVEFWRRWHITLSRFLKDYIYIPLGGNRVNHNRYVANLLITMSLGGIWHGAGWNFLLWGFAHGLCLTAVHVKGVRMPRYVSILITFFVVTLLWVLFRSNGFGDALSYYEALFDFSSFHFEHFRMDREFLIACGFLVVFGLPNSLEFVGYEKKEQNLGVWHAGVAAILLFVSLKMMATNPSVSFVYFNF